MSKIWNTSVTELITIFQEALIALLPIVEKVHITWKEGEAYDDWDKITEALYYSIVERSVGYALGLDLVEQRILPRYDSKYQNYANMSRIDIDNCSEKNNCVFVRLSTSSEPFDTVDYREVDKNGRPTSEEYGRLQLEDARFSFRIDNQVLSNISVEL